MPSERRLLRTRPLGSWLLGPADEGSDRLWIRVQVLLSGSLVLANLVGIVLVTSLLALVIPGRPVLTDDLVFLNFVVVPAVRRPCPGGGLDRRQRDHSRSPALVHRRPRRRPEEPDRDPPPAVEADVRLGGRSG